MAKNGNHIEKKDSVSEETLRELAEMQRIGNRAVKKAQEENRKNNIPNWYSVGGVIVSDQEVSKKHNKD